jgi:hypothetical protein
MTGRVTATGKTVTVTTRTNGVTVLTISDVVTPAMGMTTNLVLGYVSSDFASRDVGSSRFRPPPRNDFPHFDGETMVLGASSVRHTCRYAQCTQTHG